MSDSNFSYSDSVSGQSHISSPSSITSANLSSPRGFSFSSSSSSHSTRDSSLETLPAYSFRGEMDQSHDQSSDLEDESHNQSSSIARESLNQWSDQISQMHEDIGSMTPVEVIDLSNFEFITPARSSAHRAPDAVIDLCTPDRAHSAHRRNNLQQSISNAVVVDLDDPSPPKRSCPSFEKSQEEESYKCPVCLENVRPREPVSTKCGHVFCKDCLVAAINSVHKCPLCNKKITQRQFTRIYL